MASFIQSGSGFMSARSSPNLAQPVLTSMSSMNGTGIPPTTSYVDPNGALMNEVARREAAEARVRELEVLVDRLSQKVAILERDKYDQENYRDRPPPKLPSSAKGQRKNDMPREFLDTSFEAPENVDPIDVAISEYLAKNQDFPVTVTKLAPNYYVFGDRGQVYVTQRGEHIVVRVGGGYKSLQVFMDERALMVKEVMPKDESRTDFLPTAPMSARPIEVYEAPLYEVVGRVPTMDSRTVLDSRAMMAVTSQQSMLGQPVTSQQSMLGQPVQIGGPSPTRSLLPNYAMSSFQRPPF